MKKYGVENFSFSVIEECPLQELDNKEVYYIEKYNSYIHFPNSNGYNLTLGGNGRKITKEQIDKAIYLWEQGKTLLEISNQIHFCAQTIRDYLRRYGASYSPKENTRRTQMKKGCDCYDLWGNYLCSYSSATEASTMLNLNLHTITKSCNKDGLAITTAFSKNIGYRFIWKEKQKEMRFDRTTINNKIPDCIFRLTSSDKTVYIKSKVDLASFLELLFQNLNQ